MLPRRFADIAVIGLTSFGVLPLAFVFASDNLAWLKETTGTIVLSIVVVGLLTGFVGGTALAVARRNPLWLIATLASMCVGYFWTLVFVGLGIASMH